MSYSWTGQVDRDLREAKGAKEAKEAKEAKAGDINQEVWTVMYLVIRILSFEILVVDEHLLLNLVLVRHRSFKDDAYFC